MKFKITIPVLSCNIFVLALEIDPDLQKNTLKFGYDIIYKYEKQLCHPIDRFYVVTNF